MPSLKTSGSITRRKGMSELQRLTWLLSVPALAAVRSTLQELTGVTFKNSQQYKDYGATRMERDFKDVEKDVHFLLNFPPFTKEPFLRNIVTGEVESEQVDVDKAIPIDGKILYDITGKDANIYTFKKKATAITMRVQSNLKLAAELPTVDPILMFQRLVTVAKSSDEELQTFFQLRTLHPATFVI